MTQRPRSDRTFLSCALLSFVFTVPVSAQSTEWKEYVSEIGKFSVLLPEAPETDYRLGDPDAATGLVYVIKVYAINYYQKDAKVWSVEYLDLPAIPPDADAVKNLLERRRDKYSYELGSSNALTMNGYPALEYKIRWGRDRVEIVRIVLVKQRVYELRALIQAKHTASEEVMKFFDSFKPAPMTDEEIAAATRAAREIVAPRKLRVSDGVLQGIAVKKVQPVYTPEAKAARVSGAAKIRVLISEEGNVIDAEILECPDQLRESALAAARLWVFRPTELGGRPVKLEGVLTLKFAPR